MSAIGRFVARVRGRITGRADHAAIFGEIFHRRAWGDGESVSGHGSSRARGADFADDLAALLRRLDVQTLLDAPCGDFNWAEAIADAVPRYIGVDVVAALIAANDARYRSARRAFVRADITRDPLPDADAILCRDCLVHFADRDVWATLANFARSGARWLVTTTFVERGTNEPIRTGGWRPLDLSAAPFHFPPPLALVDERCTTGDGRYRDKRLALWEIASLRTERG